MKFLLIGNYGVGNVGDEALRQYFLQRFPEIEWAVLSAHPNQHSDVKEYPRLPGGIRSFFRTPWLQTIRAMRECDGVVFGGGSLFTDVESGYACFLWWLHGAAARVCKKRIFLAFQGIGPFRTRYGEWLAHSIARAACFISVRDQQSANRVRLWNLSIKVVQSFDPVFLLLSKECKEVRSKKLLILIPRKNSDATFRKAAKNIYEVNTFDEVTICCLEPESDMEQQFARVLQTEFACPSTIVSIHSLYELTAIIGRASMVLSHRYHGALAALACDIPIEILSQGQGDKLAELSLAIGKPSDELSALVLEGEHALKQAIAYT